MNGWGRLTYRHLLGVAVEGAEITFTAAAWSVPGAKESGFLIKMLESEEGDGIGEYAIGTNFDSINPRQYFIRRKIGGTFQCAGADTLKQGPNKSAIHGMICDAAHRFRDHVEVIVL